ncbi:hypothetical protein MATR_02030 [Marivirga tractuosa]|uniref:Secretion system C-terminal sorting domain-containing protein n=1 Tax=Marivirga tractuosa (strain ATCC 23168 / DSM 4126 / NBRC 15989 / NCIMB 1408 / VKM B-1430 / H-43) TaxID=643867 RepID=E4TV66_MARTH|nr:hypothetical protein [Marivirga tractuosa]ADR22159.1 hypothetical protein Ftrac_2177 [Marivirga tractuosa DSM 4126]BDD13378.1 hypothetical protein MATR_02030 [Marivirga tractuosa]
MIRILLILSVLYFTLSISYAQEGSKDSVEVESVEKDGRVNYPKKLLVNPEFDFKLKKTETGKFTLSFYKDTDKSTTIKIYDLIGNLIKQETVSKAGLFTKEYDLSYYNPKFFVVEAGSSEYNKTKSIIVE